MFHCCALAFTLTNVNGTLSTELVANEGDNVEICFVTTSNITRSMLEVGIRAISVPTDTTDDGKSIK